MWPELLCLAGRLIQSGQGPAQAAGGHLYTLLFTSSFPASPPGHTQQVLHSQQTCHITVQSLSSCIACAKLRARCSPSSRHPSVHPALHLWCLCFFPMHTQQVLHCQQTCHWTVQSLSACAKLRARCSPSTWQPSVHPALPLWCLCFFPMHTQQVPRFEHLPYTAAVLRSQTCNAELGLLPADTDLACSHDPFCTCLCQLCLLIIHNCCSYSSLPGCCEGCFIPDESTQ